MKKSSSPAVAETIRLLQESGAKLIRKGKHNIYRLPNGKNFTMAGTPSDHRGPDNDLALLRRLLREPMAANGAAPDVWVLKPMTTPAPDQEVVVEVEMEATTGVPVPEPTPEAPPPPMSDPEPEVEPETVEPEEDTPTPIPEGVLAADPTGTTFQLRLTQAIDHYTGEYTRLMAEAEEADRRAKLLRSLADFAGDPLGESMLRSLIPPPPPPPPIIKVVTVAPRERIQVTRESVLGAADQLRAAKDQPFNSTEVLNIMTVGRGEIESEERKRARRCIIAAIRSLVDRGQLIQTQEGNSHTEALYYWPELPPLRIRTNGHAEAHV